MIDLRDASVTHELHKEKEPRTAELKQGGGPGRSHEFRSLRLKREIVLTALG